MTPHRWVRNSGPLCALVAVCAAAAAVAAEDDTTAATVTPYSATEVTETEQRFWDGNRIVQRSTTEIHRDSHGRMRRDQSPPAFGLAPVEAPLLSIISDPVAGITLVLHHQPRTVQTLSAPAPLAASGGRTADHRALMLRPHIATAGTSIPARQAVISHPTPSTVLRPAMLFDSGGESSEEPLGAQVFDGVEAEGVRTTHTIPAGAIGNELPMEIVSERWYAPELDAVVLSRHSDPRAGETTVRLENIRLVEPAPGLFTAPEGYTALESASAATFSRSTVVVPDGPAAGGEAFGEAEE